ncbi:hypothetical protein C4J81_08035 [Deltaproteobacteria bacterium Smac51]|nr:hypothetical protein C4J81_08035 [Deltaproteobacteria bacterium Smac51]
MKIKTRCDNCGKVYNMASEYIGRTAQCKHCRHHFIMNAYEPAAEIFPAQPAPVQAAAPPQPAPALQLEQQPQYQAPQVQPPQAQQQPPVTMPYTPPREDTPPPPNFQPQPQNSMMPPQHALADQTILPNTAAMAQNYAPQPGQMMPGQMPYQQQASAAQQMPPQMPPAGNYAAQPEIQVQTVPVPPLDPRTQPLHGANDSALRGAAGRGTQTALCLKCGHSAEVPVPTKRMKISCQACGAKIAIGPEPQKKAAKSKAGGGSNKSVLILLALVFFLVAVLFIGPMFLPDIFPDIIGDLLFD